MKLKAARFLMATICFSMLIGCTSQRTSTPPARLTETPAATQAPTSTAAVIPTNTPTQSVVNTPAALPTQAPQNTTFSISGPKFDTIALGDYATLTKEGDVSFQFRVKEVITGQAAADKLVKYQLTEGMQWVIVLTEMKYLHGPVGKRVQLVTEDQFRIISNGQVLANDYLKYGPVSEHLNQISLLPGESSYGVLVFAVNKDDNRPVLRFTDAVKSYFFALASPAPAAEPLQVTPLQFGADDLGKVNNPVPLGKTVAYTLNGDTLLVTVKQVEQGMDVSRRLWDIGGVKTLPGTGLDFIMPYLEITAAQSSAELVGFKTSLFTVVSKGVTLAKGAISCPYPCIADITMYPGGEATGWLPRVKPQDDPAPLLNFNNELYFSLTGTNAGQTAAGAVTAPPTFSPNSIGYNTIKNVGESAEMEQHAVVQALAFSPDNKLLASGGDDHKIHIWNADTGAEITVLAKHKAAIKYLAFSADGKMLASVGYNEEVIVWNVADWSIIQQLKQAGNGIFGQFLPDNNLVTANQAGGITVWNVVTGEVVKQYFTQKNTSPNCQGSALYNFDMSPDGKIFAASLTCGYGVVWDPATGDRLATDYNHAIDSKKIPIVSAISVSNSSGLAAYAGSYYRHSGYLVDVLDTRNNLILGGIGTATTNVPAIAFAPNAEIIAAAIGNRVRTWWPNGFVWTGKHLIDLQAHTSQVTSIEFSLDGTLLASGDYSGKIAIWKVIK